MTQTCEIKTRLTLLTKSFCSRMGIQTTPLDAALRLSDAEVVKDLYQLWLEAGNEGTLDDFLLTFKGDQGDSNYQLWLDAGNEGTLEDFFATLHGKDIELRPTETYIQWKYVQDETWNNLISVETLKGDEIQLSVTETHIIWKYDNEAIWNNLISIAEITGPQGIQGYSLQFTWDGTSLGIKREDEIEYQYIDLKGEQGIQGIAGREVVFQTSETHIQWKYADEVIWNDLISLAEITGAQGIAGREVQIQSDETYIQWKYADEVEWNNIVLLETLRGPQGIQGIQGIAGSEVEIQNSGTHIQWRYVGDEIWNDIIAISTITGSDGEEIQLQKSLTHIQWKYISDVEWIDLVALADLKGDAGEEIQLQNNGTYIQWKYTSDITWTDLIALSALTGDAGADGEEIQLQNNGTYIQWKYTSDIEWTNLVEIALLKGDTGDAGEKIELRTNAGFIEYKYESDVDWIQLYDLSQLQGDAGLDGKSILNGTVDPTTEGADGEFYINTTSWQIFGPKTAGVWGTGTSLIGAAGADGTDGVSIIWQGSLAAAPESPSLNWGYYNTTDKKSYIYDGDSWEIISQDGTDGSDGADGQGVPTGGTTGQVLKKNSETDYDTVWADESGGGGGVEYIDTNLLSGTGTTVEDPLTFAAPSDGDIYGVQDGEYANVSTLFGEVETIVDDIIDGDITIANMIPAGGTTGQVLVKKSDTDYDVEWVTLV